MTDPNWFRKKLGTIEHPDINYLMEKLIELDVRVQTLEVENVELTQRLDKIGNTDYNLDNFTLGE